MLFTKLHLSAAVFGACALFTPSAADSQHFVALELHGARSSKPLSSVVHGRLAARGVPVESKLANAFSFYTTNLLIGSPAQNVSVIIDTGSSDLWVMSDSNPFCKSATNSNVPQGSRINCDSGVTFDSDQSSSFKANDSSSEDFRISYGDGSVATGNWGTDKVSLGTTDVDNVVFAVARESNSTLSVFGVGLRDGESTITTDHNGFLSPTYDNFPQILKNQGLIQRLSFSLWLDDMSSTGGSLVFGGLDHSKYSGSLQLVPVVNDRLVSQAAPATSLSIMLHGVSVYNNQSEVADIASFAIPALLDSGTTLSYFPQDVLTAIGQATGAQLVNSGGLKLYGMPCDSQGGLIFDLSGVKIEAPYSQLLLPLSGQDQTSGSAGTCALAIAASSKQYILGDSFLRNAYVVYDLEGLQVGLAQANFTPSDSQMEGISTGIPGASQASSYSSTAFTTVINTMSPSYVKTSILALANETPLASQLASSSSSSAPSSISSTATVLSSSVPSSSSSAPAGSVNSSSSSAPPSSFVTNSTAPASSQAASTIASSTSSGPAAALSSSEAPTSSASTRPSETSAAASSSPNDSPSSSSQPPASTSHSSANAALAHAPSRHLLSLTAMVLASLTIYF